MIEIKNRSGGRVLAVINAPTLIGADLSGADLSGADLTGADLTDADLSGADLSGADLSWANLCRADLCRANLTDADLSGANLRNTDLNNCTGNGAQIKNLSADRYPIVYTAERLQIGCKNYSFAEWAAFTDEEIEAMNDGAAKWWAEWKEKIFREIERSPAVPT